MSSIAAFQLRRAFARPAAFRTPATRRFASTSKVEEAGLDKGPKRDPELYVCDAPLFFFLAVLLLGRKFMVELANAMGLIRFRSCSVLCLVLS